MCFDSEGLAYLRTFYLVARYQPRGPGSEVPFDYGEERTDIRTSSSREAQPAKAASALRLPVKTPACTIMAGWPSRRAATWSWP